jgi:hypothetical protein
VVQRRNDKARWGWQQPCSWLAPTSCCPLPTLEVTMTTTSAWGCGDDDGDLDTRLWWSQWRPWHAAAATATMTLAWGCSDDDADLAWGCGDNYLGTGLWRRLHLHGVAAAMMPWYRAVAMTTAPTSTRGCGRHCIKMSYGSYAHIWCIKNQIRCILLFFLKITFILPVAYNRCVRP